MNKSLEAVCTSLEELSVTITNGWAGETTFTETWGWNCPALTRHDMAALPKLLSSKLKNADPEEIDANLLLQIKDWPRRLQVLQSTTVPQLYGSNCPWASMAIIGTIESLEKVLDPLLIPQDFKKIEQEKIEATKSLRGTLTKLRAIEARTAEVSSRSENLQDIVERIEQAHEAADQLPADLAELREKRADVARLLTESNNDRAIISVKTSEIDSIRGQLEDSEKRAVAILDRCDKAYRASTSEGLASAFADRSGSLNQSMWVWVLGLIIALFVGATMGSNQLHILAKAIADTQSNRQDNLVWVELILTLLSIGAPVWFAWVATKQIGQRFRLAEDYGYKASISKAYEGYRREAELLDPAFQNRLFSSALTRLDEIPLRLVETDTHGSPWHELASSNVVRQALETVPNFMGKVTDLAKQVLPQSSQTQKAVPSPKKTAVTEIDN